MSLRTPLVAATAALAVAAISLPASANLLANPSFESPDVGLGDAPGTAGWTSFNAVFTSAAHARTGAQSLKMFGGNSGAFQDFAATPGTNYAGSVYVADVGGDPLADGQIAAVNIEWRDAGGNQISFVTTRVLTGATSTPGPETGPDVFVRGDVMGIAPAGTATARFVLITGNFDGGQAGGAPFFDDANFDVASSVPEPASLGLLAVGGLLLARRRR